MKLTHVLLFILLFGLVACQSSSERFSGFLEGEEFVVVTIFDGTVSRILVKEGETVSKGQALAELDSEPLRVALKNAEAALAVLDAELDRVRSLAGRLPRGGGGSSLYSRVKKLYEVGGVSLAQLNAARRAPGSGYARSQAETMVQELEAKKDTAEARVEELVALAKEGLMKSPADGVVTKRYLQEGQKFQQGAPAFLITNYQEAYLKTSFPEKVLAQVRVGQRLPVKIDGFPSRPFEGKLVWIASEAQSFSGDISAGEEGNPRRFAVKIALSNPEGILKPGMRAEVLIPREE